MTKDNNLDDWIEHWKQKIAIAWRISDDEEAGWLEAEVRIKLGGS